MLGAGRLLRHARTLVGPQMLGVLPAPALLAVGRIQNLAGGELPGRAAFLPRQPLIWAGSLLGLDR
ncbi:MAG: hypothetical protein ACR2FU_00530 [Streptosporangiaceae bacterium]